MFRRIWSVIMSAVIFLCSLLGIHIGGHGSETEIITYDSTKTVVTISLDENPSTGYGWQYAASAEGIVQMTSDEYHSDAPAGLAGAGGIRAFSFTAVGEGTVELTFTYLRAWEGDPIRTVVIECKAASDKQIAATLVSDNG